LFYFEDASAAFEAALEMSERAPPAGLPPRHIGVQAGPVVFRDGDVYGRTVNVASRIADQATAGEVLTSQESVEQAGDVEASLEKARSVELRGVTNAVTLYRVLRRP
jgi:adenylate cyclase